MVQRLADAAAAVGYVRFAANPAHKRSKLAELPEAGRRVFTEIHDQELADLAGLADRLDPADIAAAVRVMAALTDHARGRSDDRPAL